MSGMEWLTERAACRMLAGAGLAREPARRLLRSAVAGRGLRSGAVVLYDAGRVADLVRWPVLEAAEVTRGCPYGVLVGRFPPDRIPDVTQCRDGVVDGARGPWEGADGAVFYCWALAQYGKYVPFVGTLSGYILCGGEIAGLDDDNRFDLRSPGPWFDRFRAHRMPRRRGGQSLRMRWPWSLQE